MKDTVDDQLLALAQTDPTGYTGILVNDFPKLKALILSIVEEALGGNESISRDDFWVGEGNNKRVRNQLRQSAIDKVRLRLGLE